MNAEVKMQNAEVIWGIAQRGGDPPSRGIRRGMRDVDLSHAHAYSHSSAITAAGPIPTPLRRSGQEQIQVPGEGIVVQLVGRWEQRW